GRSTRSVPKRRPEATGLRRLPRPTPRSGEPVSHIMTPHVVNVVLSGVFHASILFLVSAGLQVVFGVQKIFNLACGSFYAIGAYVGVSAVGWSLAPGRPPPRFIPPLAVAGLGVGAGGARGTRGLLRFVYDRD